MKRITIICLTILLVFVNTVPALAAGTVAIISAEDIAITSNTILVPVNISNNPGVMGFKVTASYSSDLLEISGVTAGSVTTKGNFIHNAGKVSGQVDIIWYATEQTTENGSLFVLSVKPTERFIEGESTQISLSFSQADTFDEQYNDVAFDCTPINVSYGNQEQQTDSNSAPTQENASEAPITDSQVIEAVDAAIDNSESGNTNDIDSDTLAEVNDNLKTIVGPNAPQFSTVEELKERYNTAQSNRYIEQARINIDPSKISETLNGVLNDRNASSFSELGDTDKTAAVAEAYQRMQDVDDTLPDVSSYLGDDESAEMFDSLLEYASTENEANSKEESASNGFSVYIIIIVAVVIICCVLIVIVYKKRTRKTNR